MFIEKTKNEYGKECFALMDMDRWELGRLESMIEGASLEDRRTFHKIQKTIKNKDY